MQMDLPANVESALHPLLGELALAGAEAVKVQQSPGFGDFLVSFADQYCMVRCGALAWAQSNFYATIEKCRTRI